MGLLGGASFGRGGEQLFFNAATGNLLISRQDEFLIGRGPDAAIARTYNSFGDFSDENGDNWRQSTDRRIYGLTGTIGAAGSTVKRVSGDSSEVTYAWDAAKAAYIATDGNGAYDKLTHTGGVWTWTDGSSQVTEKYAAFGALWRITEQADTDGNKLTFTYAADKLTRITTQDGNFVEYSWSGSNISQVVATYTDLPTGTIRTLTRTRYAYDASNRLEKVTVDLSPNDNSVGDGRTFVTTYAYDGTSKRIRSITQTDGSRVDIAYDASGRVASIAQTVSAGVTRTVTIAYQAGFTTITDPTGQVTRLDYNADGSLKKVTSPPAQAGAAQQIVQFGYAARGDVQSVTDAFGNATTYTHDACGNVLTSTDPLGNVVTRTYGARNELLTETRTGADQGSAAAAHTTRYVYDAENHLRYVISGEGRVTEYRYTADGLLDRTIEYPEHLYIVGTPPPPPPPSPPPPPPPPPVVGSASFESPPVTGFVTNPFVPDVGFSMRSGIAQNGSVWGFPSAPDGGQVGFMQNMGTISLFLSGLSAGTQYTATFMLAGRPGGTPPVTAWFNGTTLGTFTPASTTAYQTFTVTFTATSSDGTLAFQADPAVSGATALDNIRILGPAAAPPTPPPPPPWPAESDLNAWRNAIADRSSTLVTVNAHDVRGNLTSVTSYGAATAAGEPSTAEGFSRTFFVYNQAGQLTSRNSDGQRLESFIYDGLGRVTASIDLNGGTTSIVFDDVASRTIVTLANGLTKTSTYNLAGELINCVESHGPATGPVVWSSSFETPEMGNSHWFNPPVSGITFTGTSGIAGNGSNVYDFAPAPDGDQVAFIGGSNSSISQTVSGLTAGATYVLKFFLAWSPKYIQTDIVVSFNGTTVGTFRPTSGAFQEFTVTFTAAASTGALKFTGTSTNSNAVTAIDGIRVAATVPGSTNYVYDRRGQLRLATDATGYKSYFLYDALGRKIADVNHFGDLVEYRYDANNRLIATARYANRLTAAQLATLANPLASVEMASIRPAGAATDLWTWQVYDKNGRLIEAIEGDGSVAIYEYDKSDRLVRTVAYANKLSTAQLDVFKTAPPTAPVLPTANAAKDSVARNFYDKDGLLIGALDGEGFFSRILYDKAGQKTEEISFLTPSREDLRAAGTFDQIVAAQGASPAADRRARYVYDGQGQLRYTIDGLDQVVELTYNTAGQVVSTIQYGGSIAPTSDWTYDKIKSLVTASGLAANAATRRTWAVYDDAGRLAYSVDAEGGVTGMSYDNMGQVTKTVQYAAIRATPALPSKADMDGWASGQLTNTANRTTRFYYNERGELRFTVDAEGLVSGNEYDAEGRVVRTVRWSNAVSVTEATTLANINALAKGAYADSVMVYDSAGRLSDVFDGEGNRRHLDYNANGTVAFDTAAYGTADASSTRFVYDNAGRVIDQYLASGTPEEGRISYAYDGLGNVASVTDANRNVTTRIYDRLGRMVSQTDAENAVVGFQYNGFGEVVKVTDTRGNATYNHYDKLGRLTMVRDAENFVTENAYNAFGEVTSSIRRANRATNAADVVFPPIVAASAQDTITRFYYDRLGRQTIVRDAEDYLTETAYNAFGDVASVTRRANRTTSAVNVTPSAAASGQDAITYFYYDRLGRATVTRDAENFVTETTYNALGNVTRVIRRANRTTSPTSATPMVTVSAQDATTQFEYDRRGLLVKTTDARGSVEQYTLDALGRRISVLDRIFGKTNYAYNRRGLVTSATRLIETSRYMSDGTSQSSSVITRFEYDANGNRTKLIEASGLPEQRTTTFIYDKANRLSETRGDAVQVLSQTTHSSYTTVTPTSRIKYDAAGNVIETVDALGARALFYYDKLNRTTRDVNALGLLTKYDYDANGNVTAARAYATAVALPATAGGTPPEPSGEARETLYSYDRLNRMLTSIITGVRIGAFNGTSYTSAVGAITTSFLYDANDNVITTTDANGGVVYAYYDKLGRSIAQVDQASFLTSWTRDAEGNVLTERRAAVAATGVGTAAPPSVATSVDDRITTFTYDKNGNRLTETRTGVVAYTANASGVLAAAPTTSTISYQYNGLGQVMRKTEATGEFIEYIYDTAGRLITELRAGYADHAGSSVRPTVDYFYNGLDRLTKTRQGGPTPNTASDRISTNLYGAGGRLAQTTDAAGASYSYDYDAAGNLVREHYGRLKSDGSVVNEAVLYTRDILGRKSSQALAAWNGTAYVKGDIQVIGYNLFGEVAARGLNVASQQAQEQFAYDKAGRLWRTNSGDGVWRYFVLDGNGNQTLAIESEGTDIANKTIDEVLAIAGANPGSTYVDGINLSINVYDKRDMARETRLARRQLNGSQTTTATTVNLVASRGFTAFGEFAWEKDAAGAQTNFAYNTMGRLLQSQQPGVSITTETGAVQTVQPTEKFYYDVSGRLIGRDDANGNRTTRALLAGSGYGGTEEITTAEFHADTGVMRSGYDVFGDLRRSTDEMLRVTDMSYDKRGRLIQVTRPSGLTESFTYDHFGQRLKHWNMQLGAANVARTDYDLQGRIVSQVAFGGDETRTSYTWNSGLTTNGMGTFGGWIETTTYVTNGRTATEHSDMFGRNLFKGDLGGHQFSFTYDKAGRLSESRTTTGTITDTMNYAYLNSGLVESISTSGGSTSKTTFGYDSNGNKLSEKFTRNGVELQNATATYDAIGRMTSWAEAGNAKTPAANIQYSYDANGNVRRILAKHYSVSADGVVTVQPTGPDQTKDHWYKYDSMNRVVISMGVMSGGQITRDRDLGVAITYNRDGQRATTSRTIFDSIIIFEPDPEDPRSRGTPVPWGYDAEVREEYEYDTGGYLKTVRIARSQAHPGLNGGEPTVTPPPAVGAVRASHTHDAMGRMTRQIDWLGDGTNAAFDRTVNYNAKGQVATEVAITKQETGDLVSATTTNDFGTPGTGGLYALGAVVNAFTDTVKNGAAQGRTQLAYGYEWWDGAEQKRIISTPPTGAADSAATDYFYNAWGQLDRAEVRDGRTRTVTFHGNLAGETIRRDEADNVAFNPATGSGGDPHEIWYRFDGRQLGSVGNNGTFETDYQTSIDNRRKPPGTGPFRFGGSSAYANFDQNYSGITSYSQGSAGGSYTVRSGDTLQSIAAGLWGDSSLWFKVAEANGMTAAAGLVEGQVLTIPTGVLKNQHNARTFRSFDPSEVLGDLNPTTPLPQKLAAKNKCGVFGTILLVAIAVAVSFLTYGALIGTVGAAASAGGGAAGSAAAGAVAAGTGLSGALGAVGGAIAAGAIAGTAGALASQAFGVATGIQSKFDWKGVALSALGGAVGGALGFGPAGKLFNASGTGKFVNLAREIGRAAAASTITQGIGVATGLQGKFSWAAVAAAGAGAGVGGAVSSEIGVKPFAGDNSIGNYARFGLAQSAGAISGATTRSLIDGSDFGDNLISGLAGVIGSTIGNLVQYGITFPDPPVGGVGAAAANRLNRPLFPVRRPMRELFYADSNSKAAVAQAIADMQVTDKKAKEQQFEITKDRGPTPEEFLTWEGEYKEEYVAYWSRTKSELENEGITDPKAEQISWRIRQKLGLTNGFSPPASMNNWASDPRRSTITASQGAIPVLNTNTDVPNTSLNFRGTIETHNEFPEPSPTYYEPPPESFVEEIIVNPIQDFTSSLILQDLYFNVFPDHGSVLIRRTDTWAATIGRVVGSISPHADFINIPRSIWDVYQGKDRAWAGLGINVASIGPSPFDIVKAFTKFSKPLKNVDNVVLKNSDNAAQNLVDDAFTPNIKSPTYKRPSGYRVGVRDEVWDSAVKNSPDGKVRDPLTGRIMSKDEPWDMGHLPGHEFRRMRAAAAAAGLSRKEFLDLHNNPSIYRPELPSSNRSHKLEDMSDYF